MLMNCLLLNILLCWSNSEFSNFTNASIWKKDGNMLQIRKCCALHQYLDEWYDCVNMGENVLTEFKQELFEVSKKNESEYRIVHTNYWRKCPGSRRREFEVMSIGEDDMIYVFSDNSMFYQDYHCFSLIIN